MQVTSRAGIYLILLSVGTTACKTSANTMDDSQGQPQTFASPEDAVRQAKANFLEVLQSGRDLNLGVDAATLERAQPGAPVPRVDLDFSRLLAADTTASFASLVSEERNTVVPFVADGGVVTIVEIVRAGDRWRVLGLAGRDIAEALNIVYQAVGDSAVQRVTLYEVPNLQTRVFGVDRAGTEVLFTDYEGKFNLREGVSAAALIPVLKAGAIEFQRLYGDSLQSGRLLR